MEFDLTSAILIGFVSVLIIGLFILLVFKTDKIVKMLRLDKGFDDDKIELGNLQSTDIIKAGSFIIGGLLILYNIPPFLSYLIQAFKRDMMGLGFDLVQKIDWFTTGLYIIVGYLLITNFGFVAKILNADKKEE
jgi:hypothetical protein